MKRSLGAIAALMVLSGPAAAAVSAEEAKQLGNTLTPVGAIKAGNAQGTIPAYTGGVVQAPPGFKPDSGFWANPFAGDKPLLRIDAKNVDAHADKLSQGQIALIKKFPTSYYIDVYPTRRSMALPDKVIQATLRNATTCKTQQDYLAVDAACRGGLPFPIPKNAYEVMWNHQLRYQGDTDITTPNGRSWISDSNGKLTRTADQFTRQEKPFYQVGTADRDPQMYWRTYSITKAPARKSGEANGLIDFLDTTQKPRRAWTYTPGQRRVKLAPEFAYDTPVSSLGGVTLYDELFLFSGKMDRFDFKLLGKKEMIIPYNNYGLYTDCKPDQQFEPQHMNPECERFELHRVWVVEATLKKGMRHAYSRRTYYLDEDWSGTGMFDAFDQNGELHRAMFNYGIQIYDRKIPFAVKSTTYDFAKGMYAVLGDALVGGFRISPETSSEREMNPEAIMAKENVR